MIVEWLDTLRHALAGALLGVGLVGGLVATGLTMWSGRIERRTARRENAAVMAADTVPIPSPVSPPSPGGVRPGQGE